MENKDSTTPEPLTADDFTDFKLISAELDEVNREKRYTFECKVHAEPDVLEYSLSMHDDGEHFSLHTQNDDIWFRMDMRQLWQLELIVNREATFGLLEKDISEARTESDLNGTSSSFFSLALSRIASQAFIWRLSNFFVPFFLPRSGHRPV